MYQIKQIPEDFRVKEIPLHSPQPKGKYLVLYVKKKGMNSEEVAQRIASLLHVPRKKIGYAGNKDKRAITEQYMSVQGVKWKGTILCTDPLEISALGYLDEPITLGCLKGNVFEITIRNVDHIPGMPKKVLNLFGPQRFSDNNAQIGKLIVQRKFLEAARELALREAKVHDHLQQYPQDGVGALLQIPKKDIQLRVHSYQSLLWNNIARKIALAHPDIVELPLVGFGMDAQGIVKDIIEETMHEEGITERDFVIREIPNLSAEGAVRNVWMHPRNLFCSGLEDDDLNPGMKKFFIRFDLDKGCYATVFIDAMVSES